LSLKILKAKVTLGNLLKTLVSQREKNVHIHHVGYFLRVHKKLEVYVHTRSYWQEQDLSSLLMDSPARIFTLMWQHIGFSTLP